MTILKQLWITCFGERLNKQEIQNVVDLLQSDCEEDFLLGRAILENRNIKLGRSRLDKIMTGKWKYLYHEKQLYRAEYYDVGDQFYTIVQWQPEMNYRPISWK